jgi:hypothetical protein
MEKEPDTEYTITKWDWVIIIGIILIFLLAKAIEVNADTVTIGIEPSLIYLNFPQPDSEYDINFKFFNSNGDTDANYTIEFDSSLLGHVYEECDLGAEYWCEDNYSFIVPVGTDRLGDNVKFKMRFLMDGQVETFNSSMYIYALPVDQEIDENVSGAIIRSRISVQVFFNPQFTTTTIGDTNTATTTTTMSESDRSILQNILNPTTTTTITVPFRPDNVQNPVTTTIYGEAREDFAPDSESKSMIEKIKEWNWTLIGILMTMALIVIGIYIYFYYFY